MSRRTPRRRPILARAVDAALAVPLAVGCRMLPGVPARGVLAFADALAYVVFWLDPRGRRVARQNLRAVFGDGLSRAQRRRLVLASYRNALRSIVLLVHLQPLTPRRYRRWVDVSPEAEARIREAASRPKGPVVVSGHLGNWELMLASRAVFDIGRPLAYLAEDSGSPRLDDTLARLRDHGASKSSRRKGGARAMRRALDEGCGIGLLVDRNVRRRHGGRWVPFLGLPARTTPLGATLARRYDAPLHVMLCLPVPGGRYRLWVSPDLRGPDTGDADADAMADTQRVNDVLSRLVREQPDAWTWMMKRFKDRPTPELGPYPPYSRYEPEGKRRGAPKERRPQGGTPGPAEGASDGGRTDG